MLTSRITTDTGLEIIYKIKYKIKIKSHFKPSI